MVRDFWRRFMGAPGVLKRLTDCRHVLGQHSQIPDLVRRLEDDVLITRGRGFTRKDDALVPPAFPVISRCLFTMIALEGQSGTGVRVLDIAMLDEDDFALSSATGAGAEQAERTIGNALVHRLTHHAHDEVIRPGVKRLRQFDPGL